MDKKIKVIIDNVEMEVLVSEEELAKLTEKKQKKTGYERAKYGEYYVMTGDSKVLCEDDVGASYDDNAYESANYYTDKTLAENNARADKLLRQLRRFAVETCEEVEWDIGNRHYYIYYDHDDEEIRPGYVCKQQIISTVYFDSLENAQKAIYAFKNELIWYFTEYRDRV